MEFQTRNKLKIESFIIIHLYTHGTHVFMIMIIIMMTIKNHENFYKLECNTLLSIH